MPSKNINGIKLHYTEHGNGNQKTIVFAHPVLFDSAVFDFLVAELENDFHLVFLDLHGHAQSGYRIPLTVEEMTADYNRLLVTLNLSNVAWVGYSVGGMIGMRLALEYPKTLSSLILMATSARLDPPQIREQTWWLWQMLRAGHREDIVDAALRFFFAPATFSTQPELVASHRQKILNYSQAQARGMFEVARAVIDRTDIGERINAIDVPTLVIAGREDLAPVPAEMEFIASSIPNSELAILDDASHLLALERPREVTRILWKFLRALSANANNFDGKVDSATARPQFSSGIEYTKGDGHVLESRAAS